MRRLSWLLALWFFSPIAVQADTEPVLLEEPIVIQSNETFNGAGKRFISCERPAFQLEGIGAVLENVEIEQCERTTVPAMLVEGLGNQVIDARIEAAGTGIAVRDSHGVRLIRPNVTGTGRGEGISVHSSEATVIKGAIIDHARDGIYIEDGSGHELVRPLVMNSRYGIHLMFPTDVSITSPILHHNETGAMVMGTERVSIENGQIHDQTGATGMGLMLFEAVETTVRANAIHGNRVGIYAEKSEWTAIHHNGVNGNDIALRLQRATGMTLAGNDLTHNRYPVISFKAADNVIAGNRWGGLTLDLTEDGQSEIPYRADPYLFLLADSYEAFELLYGAPGLTVLERVLRSPDEVTLIDTAPLVTNFKFTWQGTVGATVLSGLLMLLWRFGRKQDDYL